MNDNLFWIPVAFVAALIFVILDFADFNWKMIVRSLF